MAKMKFYIRIEKDYSWLGAVTEEGGIVIDKRAFHRVDMFLSVLSHEVAHRFFDCFNIGGTIHYWLDIAYARIGLYPYPVSRRLTIERVKEQYGRD